MTTRPRREPSRAEDCGNGVDNDCNGIADDCVIRQDWYRDADGDGYGDAADSTSAPTASPGYVADATDCDDADPLVHPGADERCNDADDDCDGQTDEGIDQTWYVDADGDGYGGEAASGDCEAPPDAAAVDGDCDDGDPAVSPAATEIWYDGIDQDCDGNDADRDLDGFAAEVSGGTDCDDDDPAIHPDADEVIDDGVDQDCNGADAITTFGVAGKRPTGCGCAAPTAPPGWVFLLAAVLVRRQRTRSAHRTRATCGRTG
ncbi:MAG: putative metal-binding motif-containing protein [Alphaproteobacteria bacterium]|nr:putative metal-binding motif-containing protein [Alphaproteobacteria bacterium]